MVHIGELLAQERKRQGLTLSEVAKHTKIREPFLLAIEKGEFQKLPSSAYAAGFVKNYIKFLGLPEVRTLALFRREFAAEGLDRVLPRGFTREVGPQKIRIKLTQSVILIVLVFLVLAGYLLFQYRYAILPPPLSVDTPKEMATLSSSSVPITGKTDPNVIVTINSETVAVDNDGNFRKTLTAFTGKNTVTVKVVNHFGKEAILVRHFTVKSG